MYRVAFSGQTGFHQRMQYDNQILSIVEDPAQVNPDGGFLSYGLVKNPCVIVRGSLPGSKKRLITLTAPRRPARRSALPVVELISTHSHQGN